MKKIKDYPIHQSNLKGFSEDEILELYKKLVDERVKIQNRPKESKKALSLLGNEKGGDQADLVSRLQEESQYTSLIKKDGRKLNQIHQALDRMEKGGYGICEYTKELIEFKRLCSLPWTTLSIEAAEELEEESSAFKMK